MRKQRRRSVTAKLIIAFVFAKWVVDYNTSTSYIRNFKSLTIFSNCAAQFVSDLVGNPEDRFCHDPAQIIFPSYANSGYGGNFDT